MKMLAKLQSHLEFSGLLGTHSVSCNCKTETLSQVLVGCCLGILSATWGHLQGKPGGLLTLWQQVLQGRRRPLQVATVEWHISKGNEGSNYPIKGEIAPWRPQTLTTLRWEDYPGVYTANSAYKRIKDHIHGEKNICRELKLKPGEAQSEGSSVVMLGLCWGLKTISREIVFMVNTGHQRGKNPKDYLGFLQVRWIEEITH